jgi:hypothetical protein
LIDCPGSNGNKCTGKIIAKFGKFGLQPKVRVLITSLHESGSSTQQIVCETFLEKCLFTSKGLFFLLVALYKSNHLIFNCKQYTRSFSSSKEKSYQQHYLFGAKKEVFL